ncbi:MAG: hypothetical protein JWL75_552 [Parcubacteria group bacterium]|nr:hypothetical protein [Parcubacteria group bacterium]
MTSYLIAIFIPLGILVGFLLLITVEGRRGARIILPGRRYQFDLKAARALFILKHVDWGAFAHDLTRTGIERMAHDIAHSTLMAVRALERQLTQVVRTLRARREHPLFPISAADRPSRIQTTISYVKKTVRRSRKQPTETPDQTRAQ